MDGQVVLLGVEQYSVSTGEQYASVSVQLYVTAKVAGMAVARFHMSGPGGLAVSCFCHLLHSDC